MGTSGRKEDARVCQDHAMFGGGMGRLLLAQKTIHIIKVIIRIRIINPPSVPSSPGFGSTAPPTRRSSRTASASPRPRRSSPPVQAHGPRLGRLGPRMSAEGILFMGTKKTPGGGGGGYPRPRALGSVGDRGSATPPPCMGGWAALVGFCGKISRRRVGSFGGGGHKSYTHIRGWFHNSGEIY